MEGQTDMTIRIGLNFKPPPLSPLSLQKANL